MAVGFSHKSHSNVSPSPVQSISFSIKEVLSDATLYVGRVSYSGIANWFEKENDNSMTRIAYIQYSGSVNYSVPFDEIEVQEPDENQTVWVSIPKIHVDYSVDNGSIIPIFIDKNLKKNYDSSQNHGKLVQICNDDMHWSVQNESTYLEIVEKYTKDYIKGLTKHFFEGSQYNLDIKIKEME